MYSLIQGVSFSKRSWGLLVKPALWKAIPAAALILLGYPAVAQTNKIAPGDVRVNGDFDGDHILDAAFWRPSNGTWYIIPSSTPGSPITQQWGLQGDIPVPGDYNNDGKTDFAVWRPSNATWFVLYRGGEGSYPGPSIPAQQWGLPGDIPLTGDFDNDGKADFAVYRPSTQTWFVIESSNPTNPVQQQWGLPGDIAVPGDYNGDGSIDFAVWRPASGMWLVLYSGDTTSYPNASLQQQWGLPGDVPMAMDRDGDGKDDFAVWRPGENAWYVRPSGNQSSQIVENIGLPTDIVNIHST